MLITTISGIINASCTNPIWFVNTRISIAKDSAKSSFFETVQKIYSEEGFGAFYKGFFPNLILVLNPIINFMVYEAIKKYCIAKKYSLNALQVFLFSSISKAIATLLTYPVKNSNQI